MIRIITDNLLYMGIASAVFVVLLLLITLLSRRRLSSRAYLIGWIVALAMLIIPGYALISVMGINLTPTFDGSNSYLSAAQYRILYTEKMERNFLSIFTGITDGSAANAGQGGGQNSIQSARQATGQGAGQNSGQNVTQSSGQTIAPIEGVSATDAGGAITGSTDAGGTITGNTAAGGAITDSTVAAGVISNSTVSASTNSNGTAAGSSSNGIESEAKGSADKVGPSLREVIFAVWILGVLVLAVAKATMYLRFRQMILQNSRPSDEIWLELFPENARGKLRIREAKIPSPVVFGIIHPTVLIPERRVDNEHMRYALMHEGLHIVRKDLLLRTVAEAAAILNWVNPFAWLIRRKITQYSENSCDEAVAVRLSAEDRQKYAMSILEFMDTTNVPEPRYPATLMSFSGEAEHVKRRLKHIMEYKAMKKPVAVFAACLIMTAAIIGGLTACSLAFSGDAKSTEGTNTVSPIESSGQPENTDASASPTISYEVSETPVPSVSLAAIDLASFAIAPTYDYASEFSGSGYAIVETGTGPDAIYFFIDADGKQVPTVYFDSFLQSPFHYWKTYGDFGATGYVWIEKNNKWGFVNQNCEVVVEPQYDGAMPFAVNGFAGVKIDGKWGFIDESGKIVIEPQFEGVDIFRDNGLCTFSKDGKYGLINEKGRVIVDPIYDSIIFEGEFDDWRGPFEDNGLGLAAVCKDGKWGLINTKGTVIAKPAYDYFFSFGSNQLAVVEKDGKFGYINEQGAVVIACQFDSAYTFTGNGFAIVSMDKKFGFINEKGEYIIEPQYVDVRTFADDGLAAVKVDGKWGFINTKGEYVLAPQYEDTDGFNASGIAAVKVDGKWGIINEPGQYVIQPEYAEIYFVPTKVSEAFMVRKPDGLYGMINSAGDQMVAQNYSYLTLPRPNSDEGYDLINRTELNAALIMQNDKSGIASLDGKILIPPVAEQGSLIIASNGMVSVLYNGKYGYIQIAGEHGFAT